MILSVLRRAFLPAVLFGLAICLQRLLPPVANWTIQVEMASATFDRQSGLVSVTHGDEKLSFYDGITGAPLRDTFPGSELYWLAMSPDRRQLVGASATSSHWRDRQTGTTATAQRPSTVQISR